jgi:hypothetical protein
MSSPDKKKGNLKKKIVHEVAEYWVNFCYLALVFAAFTWYRRIVLAAHDITYTNYWVPLIQALIFAKVISIGSVFRLGHGLEQKPLIYPTLYKTAVFTLFVAVFTLVEHMIKGLLKGKGLMGGLDEYFGKGPYEFLAGCLIFLVALIPFFGVKELGRVLGEDKIRALFFLRRADSESSNRSQSPVERRGA